MSQYLTKLLDVEISPSKELGPDLFSVELKNEYLAQHIQPGEFLNLWVPGDNSEILRLPFSFSAVDKKRAITEVLYQVLGKGTKRLSLIKDPCPSTVLGPAGHGWTAASKLKEEAQAQGMRDQRVLLVAGGLGIAPLLPQAQALAEAQIAFDVVIGAPSASRLVFIERLKDFAADKILISTDDGSAFHKGFCTELSEELLRETNYSRVFTCGPEAMQFIVKEQAAKRNIPCEVSLERGMICGIGACMSCVVKLSDGSKAGVCMRGPVFLADEVDWND